MKLIKLSGQNGEFQNIFNEDIRVNQYSKIGLVSCSFILTGYSITASNNEFYVQTKKKNPKFRVTLNVGNYDRKDFINELIRGLNSALGYLANGYDLSEQNYQFHCSIDENYKLIIYFKRENQTSTPSMKLNNMKFEGGVFSRNGGDIAKWDCYGISNLYMANGIFSSFAHITDDNMTCAFGILDEEYAISNGELTPADYVCCVYTENNKFYFFDGQNNIDSGIVTKEGMPIFMDLASGQLRFSTLVNGTNYEIIGAIDWLYQTDKHYLYAISFVGNYAFKDVTLSFDPYINTSTNVFFKQAEKLNVIDLLALSRGKTVIDFETIKPESKKLLGFKDGIIESKTTSSGYFEADTSVNNSHPSNIHIEIPNLSIQSFDGLYQRQRNILEYISTLKITDDRYEYVRENPLFIDINNASPFNLNNIKIIIADEQNEILQLREVSVVLLIND